MPKVSVIMPTYQHRDSVEKAIQSVVDQSFRDFELLVIDDGSIDGTHKILRRYQRSDPRIRVFRKDRNTGVPANLCNEAVRKYAAGEFIAFQFDDDVWFPWCLESLIREAEPNDFIYGQTVYVNLREKRLLGILGTAVIDQKMILEQNPVANNAVLIRKTVFLDLAGFDENPIVKRVCDWDLWIRLVYGKYRIRKIPELLSICYAYKPNSVGLIFEYDANAVRAYIKQKLGRD